jgi:diguanylate cyclase (GGDEF)-like protein
VYEQRRKGSLDDEHPLSVAILTLDSLPEITMKMGRDSGDRFLLEVCSAIHDALGKEDTLGRWETSELVAVLPGKTPDEVRRVLEAIIQTLSNDDALEEYRRAGIEVSLAGGVATATRDQSLRDAISVAERSRYGVRSEPDRNVHTDQEPLELDLQRILVVEDDRVTAALLHHRLVRDGHEVFDFANGSEAFEWADREGFDLAVLDVKLPGMDGFELLTKLRAIPRYVDVPIIMLTGMGSEPDVIRGLELGADDYMLKPFSPSELLARVRRLLYARAAGEGPDAATQPSGAREAQA